jgi:competence protein ComEC
MERIKKHYRIIGSFSILLLALLILVILSFPDDNLQMAFCDVGQGDAILVNYKNKQVLIDGGLSKNSGQLLSCLSSQMPFWDRTIEVVVNTHPDEDHFGGLIEIVKRYRIDNYLHNGFGNSQSWKFEQFKKLLIDKNVCSKMVAAGDAFSVGEAYFEIQFPFPDNSQASNLIQDDFYGQNKKCLKPEFKNGSDSLNNSSLVLHLNFGRFDALLTGDIESEIEKILVWRRKIQPVEILKIAHHGSKTSTSQELISAVSPQLAVISVGENSFGHPAEEVLERLRAENIDYLTTKSSGTIKIVSDGKKWFVEQ